MAVKFVFLACFIIMAFIVYYLFLRTSVINLYCDLQVKIKINNFKRSVKRNGQLIASEDEALLNILAKPMYQRCIQIEMSQLL